MIFERPRCLILTRCKNPNIPDILTIIIAKNLVLACSIQHLALHKSSGLSFVLFPYAPMTYKFIVPRPHYEWTIANSSRKTFLSSMLSNGVWVSTLHDVNHGSLLPLDLYISLAKWCSTCFCIVNKIHFISWHMYERNIQAFISQFRNNLSRVYYFPCCSNIFSNASNRILLFNKKRLIYLLSIHCVLMKSQTSYTIKTRKNDAFEHSRATSRHVVSLTILICVEEDHRPRDCHNLSAHIQFEKISPCLYMGQVM